MPMLHLSRRHAIQRFGLSLAALGATGWGVSHAAADAVTLPTTNALPDALSQALQRKQPLVVMVSLHGCAFCKVVRENYLQPLRASGLQVVQIDMRDHRALADFDGTALTQDAWVRKQGIKIAPTVLFFGPHGKEVAKRLTGAYLPDFYGAYLDEQLAVARRAVTGP
jgi:thioredoxin-related protein